jgi:predicted RNase H-like nuclease (RuvC/YqgF family)
MSEVKSRVEATSELILVLLKRKRIVTDDKGKVVNTLRTLCKLPEGKSFHALVRDAVRRLENDKLVEVERNATRTFMVTITTDEEALAGVDFKALRAAKQVNLALIKDEVSTDVVGETSEPQNKSSMDAPALRPIEELVELVRNLTEENRDLDTRLAAREQECEKLRQQVAAFEAERASDIALAEEALRPYRL